MSRTNDSGIERGGTLFGGTPTAAVLAKHIHILGKRYLFEDVDHSDLQSGLGTLSKELVECMVVKNDSGGALLPGQIVTFDPATPWYVSGALATANDPKAYVVDEYLPAAGVADDDIFFVVTKGPTKPLCVSSGTTNDGTPVASTATSGRAGVQGTPADATAARDQVYAVLGVLLQDATNGNTQKRVRVLPNLWR